MKILNQRTQDILLGPVHDVKELQVRSPEHPCLPASYIAFAQDLRAELVPLEHRPRVFGSVRRGMFAGGRASLRLECTRFDLQ